jgi:hypothetical protein
LPKKLNTNRNKYTKIANRILRDLATIKTKLTQRPLNTKYILNRLRVLVDLITTTKNRFAIDLRDRISDGLKHANFYYNENTPLVNAANLNRQIPTSTINMYAKIINTVNKSNLQKNTIFPPIAKMDAALLTYDKQMKYWNASLSGGPPPPKNRGGSLMNRFRRKKPNNANGNVVAPKNRGGGLMNRFRRKKPNNANGGMVAPKNRGGGLMNRFRRKKPNNANGGMVNVVGLMPSNNGTAVTNRLPKRGLKQRARNYMQKRKNNAANRARQNNLNAAELARRVKNIEKNVSGNNMS